MPIPPVVRPPEPSAPPASWLICCDQPTEAAAEWSPFIEAARQAGAQVATANGIPAAAPQVWLSLHTDGATAETLAPPSFAGTKIALLLGVPVQPAGFFTTARSHAIDLIGACFSADDLGDLAPDLRDWIEARWIAWLPPVGAPRLTVANRTPLALRSGPTQDASNILIEAAKNAGVCDLAESSTALAAAPNSSASIFGRRRWVSFVRNTQERTQLFRLALSHRIELLEANGSPRWLRLFANLAESSPGAGSLRVLYCRISAPKEDWGGDHLAALAAPTAQLARLSRAIERIRGSAGFACADLPFLRDRQHQPLPAAEHLLGFAHEFSELWPRFLPPAEVRPVLATLYELTASHAEIRDTGAAAQRALAEGAFLLQHPDADQHWMRLLATTRGEAQVEVAQRSAFLFGCTRQPLSSVFASAGTSVLPGVVTNWAHGWMLSIDLLFSADAPQRYATEIGRCATALTEEIVAGRQLPWTANALAQCRAALGDFAGAITAIDLGARHGPILPRARTNNALLLWWFGQPTLAATELALDDAHTVGAPDELFVLAVASAVCGDSARALHFYRALETSLPTFFAKRYLNRDFWFWQAAGLATLGDLDQFQHFAAIAQAVDPGAEAKLNRLNLLLDRPITSSVMPPDFSTPNALDFPEFCTWPKRHPH